VFCQLVYCSVCIRVLDSLVLVCKKPHRSKEMVSFVKFENFGRLKIIYAYEKHVRKKLLTVKQKLKLKFLKLPSTNVTDLSRLKI